MSSLQKKCFEKECEKIEKRKKRENFENYTLNRHYTKQTVLIMMQYENFYFLEGYLLLRQCPHI